MVELVDAPDSKSGGSNTLRVRVSLRPPSYGIDKLNSLVELYFKKCEEVDPSKPFLKWLKPGKSNYNWGDIKERIFKLSYKIKSLINAGDRCLILSENRPYWLMSDIAVMNAGGISVPIFTTYSSNDYEYILDDCKPSLVIVSNDTQFKKIKKYINLDKQKIISFEEIETKSLLIQDILNEDNYEIGRAHVRTPVTS